jgi:hypothetical protein
MKTFIKTKTDNFGKIFITFNERDNEYELWHEDDFDKEFIASGSKKDLLLKAKRYFAHII